ncbi:hypothetical protein V7114_24375 [Neobacillus niacini]|uniref:hypothetical protein n=1 Tax=Neobacillus niacini TaxID=86668 RepID=UPI002FFFC4F4
MKEKLDTFENLYNWSDGLEGGDNYLRYLLKNVESVNVLSNMNLIHEKLLSNSNKSIKDLRLLRAYFKAYKERYLAFILRQ